MKSKILFILISLFIVTVLYLGGHYFFYGALVGNCNYTEDKIPVPEQLAKGEIIVARDAHLAVGHNTDYGCLKIFGRIDKQIIGPEEFNDLAIIQHDFIDRGITIETLKKGTSFHVVDIIAATKHGISTIDSGPGPIYFLILKDQNNVFYQVSTVSLGLDSENFFLSLVDESKVVNTISARLLGADSFTEEGNSIIYTGKLTELPNDELQGAYYPDWISPEHKQLFKRLARGEKFTISVEIETPKQIQDPQ